MTKIVIGKLNTWKYMGMDVYVCTSKGIAIENKILNKKSYNTCFSSISFASLTEPP